MASELDAGRCWRVFEARDARFDGQFVVAVKTTGVFCRPSCRVRPPLRKNVEFFRSAGEAMAAGYRPCRRCRPLMPVGAEPPLVTKLKDLARTMRGRVTETDLQRLGICASTARRQFVRATGMTFYQWQRHSRPGGARVEDGRDRRR